MEHQWKTCTRCKEAKPLEMYSGHTKMRDGKQSQCKSCFAERARIRRMGRPCKSCGEKIEDDAKPNSRMCKKCGETCYKCKTNPRHKMHRMCKQCHSVHDKQRKSGVDARIKERITRIATNYKVGRVLACVLSIAKHCEACGKECTRAGELHVDHCHDSGIVRGVLCQNCNMALGNVRDSKERLMQLIAYLDKSADFMALSDYGKAGVLISNIAKMEKPPPEDDE